MAPSLYISRNPRGSSVINLLLSGFSNETYCFPLKTSLARVVLPDWRGPTIAIALKLSLNSLTCFAAIRVIMSQNYNFGIKFLNCKKIKYLTVNQHFTFAK